MRWKSLDESSLFPYRTPDHVIREEIMPNVDDVIKQRVKIRKSSEDVMTGTDRAKRVKVRTAKKDFLEYGMYNKNNDRWFQPYDPDFGDNADSVRVKTFLKRSSPKPMFYLTPLDWNAQGTQVGDFSENNPHVTCTPSWASARFWEPEGEFVE